MSNFFIIISHIDKRVIVWYIASVNEWNRMQMALDPSGLTESCDRCNALITNWDHIQWSFLTFDGKIVCNECRTELLKTKNLTNH
jgi:hypothetical protein